MPTFFLLSVIPGLWFAWKAFRSRLPWPVKLILVLLAIAISQIYNIQYRLFGSLSGPNAPSWLLELQIWAFMALALSFLASLLFDLGRLTLRIVRFLKARAGARTATAPERIADGAESARQARKTAVPGETGERTSSRSSRDTALPSPARRSFLAGGAACGLGFILPAGAAVSGYGVKSAVAAPVLHRWDAFLPDLPEGLDGFRVAFFADLHLGPLTRRANLAELVTGINDWHPHVVLLGGDLADGHPQWRCADGQPRGTLPGEIGRLESVHGVFACTGNHEYYSYYNRWTRLWREQGVRFLHNGSVELAHHGATLVVGGLDDIAGRARSDTTTPFRGTLTAEAKKRAFRVLLDHRPGQARANARNGAQLQLSGHTHGGQLAGLSHVIARANRGFVRGWYDVAGMPLFVTSGAALWSGFAMRLGVPSEAACITLRKGKSRPVFTRTA